MDDGLPYPWIEFIVSIGTWDMSELAYVDTGYDGALLIPAGLGREILAEPYHVLLEVGDGAVAKAPSWSGFVELDGHRFQGEVSALGSRFSARP